MPLAAILGSAFADSMPEALDLQEDVIETDWGEQAVHWVGAEREAMVIFRHGVPHRRLPNQINYRAQAAALQAVGCEGVLITSSVGVVDPEVPIYEPLVVEDLIMLENRLPDGSACTMFTEPTPNQGHLLVHDGLFSTALTDQVRTLARAEGAPVADSVVFAYVQGPRSKTPAENRALPRTGAQVNSMTLGPEVVLANELEIPCAALVVGHKYSLPDHDTPPSDALATTLDRARTQQERIVHAFLHRATPVPFGNELYRF